MRGLKNGGTLNEFPKEKNSELVEKILEKNNHRALSPSLPLSLSLKINEIKDEE